MTSSDRSTKTSNAIATFSNAIKNGFRWWMKYVPTEQRWSDINIEKFLQCYRSQPILWDKTHESYTKRPMRMQAYTAIAEDLGLIGIGERECMDLVRQLKKLYTDYRQGEKDRVRSRYNYCQPPRWYYILDEIVERAIERAGEKDGQNTIEPSSEEITLPQDACRPVVYIEDNWTPQHFKTNVADWFTDRGNEKLSCTCRPNFGKMCNDVGKNTSSSTDIGDSKNSMGSVKPEDTVACQSIPWHTCSVEVSCDKSVKEVGQDLDKDHNKSCCIRKSKNSQAITKIAYDNKNKSSSSNKFGENLARIGNCSYTTLQRSSDVDIPDAMEEHVKNGVHKEVSGHVEHELPLEFNSDCVLRKKKSSSVSCRSYGSTINESSSSSCFCYSPLSLSEIDMIIRQKRTFAPWAR